MKTSMPGDLTGLAGLLPERPLDEDRRQRLRARLVGEAENLREQRLLWQDFLPGMRVCFLEVDRARRRQACYLAMARGAVIPPHRHHDQEICLVLSGALRMGKQKVAAGECLIAGSGSRHDAIVAEGRYGALVLLRSELSVQLAELAARAGY